MGWLPRAGYADNTEGQNEIAHSSDNDSDGDGNQIHGQKVGIQQAKINIFGLVNMVKE